MSKPLWISTQLSYKILHHTHKHYTYLTFRWPTGRMLPL